ncbi:SurA N-terminal domain-containing protein [Shinella zoogloeoides]|uniref:Peptidylprolyl isomerase n=1 Tax=Shinella zoogloeoides TaxID=352475 RepID=A0A6N8T976_SHIZO|nr:peptidylprolyl isomerase [Shinella zoogloeoides]MXN99518.1 peptidylprolyl isomerase [Shinella zoogloeoides]UEX82705.1 peptidylprolyl isomerase [Shinella zoogloeoides]
MMGRQSPMRAMMMGVALAAAVTITVPAGSVQAASSVVAVVNNTPITSGDLERRVNFLKLQRAKGNLRSVAREQLIEDTLKRAEILKQRASVSTAEVDAAYARFASSNKMSTEQLAKVLNQAGVGPDHFKQFIALQMSWPRVVNARFGREANGKSLVERMQENGGKKPVTTEYFLKQVIFVVPEKRRNAILGKRKAEAEASRSKFPGCDQAKAFAATMHDVSIRDLGRVLAPQMPEDWKPLIEKAKGQTTGTRVTERGVEYLAICKQREVNDDVAAEMVFRAEDLAKAKGGEEDANSKKYVAELRKKATITER